MLVLVRKEGESVQVGDVIEIVVLKLKGGRVKIGLTAPKHVSIIRGELSNTMKEIKQNVQTELVITAAS